MLTTLSIVAAPISPLLFDLLSTLISLLSFKFYFMLALIFYEDFFDLLEDLPDMEALMVGACLARLFKVMSCSSKLGLSWM